MFIGNDPDEDKYILATTPMKINIHWQQPQMKINIYWQQPQMKNGNG